MSKNNGGKGSAPRASAPVPAPKAPPVTPSVVASASAQKSGGGNGTNQAIQKQLASVGSGVNYIEASAIAQKLGVSVDRVYNQTAKTGQNAVAGGAAANAGYVPTSQLKVSSPITSGYVQQAAVNAQNQIDLANASATSANGAQTSVVPEFDWEAWNAQMLAQQAAIWESMDAMNAEFIRKQEAWLAQRDPTSGQQSRSNAITSAVPADKATVKRKKRTNSTAAATGLNTSSTATSLSLGGGSAGGGGGLSIGKG